MATAPNEVMNEVDERTKPPFVRRVRVRGHKSIAFCDLRLRPLTILVGRNAAGKSNFLDALAFLRDAIEIGVAEAVKRRGGWSSVVCRTPEAGQIEIGLEAGFTCGRPYRLDSRGDGPVSPTPSSEEVPNLEGVTFSTTYRLEVSADARSTPTISREVLEIADTSHEYHGRFQAHNGILERERKKPRSGKALPLPHSRDLLGISRPGFPLLSLIGTQPFIDLADGLRTMRFYNFQPEAMRPVQKPLLGAMLEKDGRNIASVVESLKEIDPDTVQRVREYLAIIGEEVKSFDVVRYGEYETLRFLLQGGSRRKPLEFDAASMSDGTLRALGALMAAFQIHLPTGPSVVGIEEPEAALHPAATHTLVDALQEATQRTQILLTTHSGDLLADRDLDPGQVLVVRNRNGQTQITPVDPASREIIRKELYSLADLQRMDQLELDQADLERQAKVAAESEDQ